MADDSSLRELVPALPLPLAQLATRVLHAKSPAERCTCAYLLAEAALKLATAGRVGLYLEHGLQPGARLAHRLELLTVPIPRHWWELLREVNDTLGNLPDAGLVPLAAQAQELKESHPHWEEVRLFAQHAASLGVVDKQRVPEFQARGLVGFFELIVEYGEHEHCEGAPQREARQDARTGTLLANALSCVLQSPAFLGGLKLARPLMVEVSASTGTSELKPVWEELMGTTPVVTNQPAGAVSSTQLYLMRPGFRVCVHPFMMVRKDALEREQVGFLNRTVRRTRRLSANVPLQEIRRIDYMDYASGELFGQGDAITNMAALLARLRGCESLPPEVVSAAAEHTEQTVEKKPELPPISAIIGDFELIEELGRGGMGVVYKARQLSTRRMVALKVLPPTRADDQVALARFRREVQALQRCDHPNVVKVLTSGCEVDRHYFAMEYVEGANLSQIFKIFNTWVSTGTELKDGHLGNALAEILVERRLALSGVPQHALLSTLVSGDPAREPDTLEERGKLSPSGHPGASRRPPSVPSDTHQKEPPVGLRWCRLFADAASGLGSLHAVGVIHRDIKPGNIMLTSDGRRLVIMDLGLARLDDESQQLTSASVQVLGTLRYMPPEQLERRRDALDHRADIYSLGATLYEMCTGKRFLDGETDERLIQQVLSERPIPARHIAPGLPKDVGTLLDVATAKLPEHRYQSAQAMEEDLRAVADGRPIRARDISLMRLTGVWIRHHKVATAAVLLFTLGGLLNLGGYLYLRQVQERMCSGSETRLTDIWDGKRKQELRAAFARSGVSYAEEARRGVETALDAYTQNWVMMHRETCESGRIRGELSEQAMDARTGCLDQRLAELRALTNLLVRADAAMVERAVGAAFALTPLASCTDSRLLAGKEKPQRDELSRKQNQALLERLAEAKVAQDSGQYARGLEIARLVLQDARAGGHRPAEAEALLRIGGLEQESGDYKAAERTLREAAQTGLAAGRDEVLPEAYTLLTMVVGVRQSRHEQGYEYARDALAAIERLERKELEGPLLHVLAILQSEEGDYDTALTSYHKAVTLEERDLGPRHPNVARMLNGLGGIYISLGRYKEGLPFLERALAIDEEVLGSGHPDVGRVLNNIGAAYAEMAEHDQALTYHQRALSIREGSLGSDHPDVAQSLNNISGVLCAKGDCPKAIPLLERAAAILEKRGLEARVAGVLTNLAGVLVEVNRHAEAIKHLEHALTVNKRVHGPEHPNVAATLHALGYAHTQARQLERALDEEQEAVSIYQKTLGMEHPTTGTAETSLADVLRDMGRHAQALDHYTRALATLETALGPDHPDVANVLSGQGRSLVMSGQARKAVPLLQRAANIYKDTNSDPAALASARFWLARALWDTGKERGKALRLARMARDALAGEPHHADELAEVQSWLQRRDRSARVKGKGAKRAGR